jgi:hypothetical protein
LFSGAEEACEKYLSALTSAPQIRGKQKQDRAPLQPPSTCFDSPDRVESF